MALRRAWGCVRTHGKMKQPFALIFFSVLTVLAALAAYAKDPPAQVIVWPESGTPVLRFTFGKFKEVGSLGSERSYVTETTAENLWSKAIGNANFSLYLYDKNKTRIAEATINVSNICSGRDCQISDHDRLLGPACLFVRGCAISAQRTWADGASTDGFDHGEYRAPRRDG
jgi:hypothetical protein